jgi:hypothetical protein
MSWLENVNWQQVTENAQRLDMLRLQQEQADSLREQTELLKSQVNTRTVSAPARTVVSDPFGGDRVARFVSEINTYIFSYLIPTKNWVEIDALVKLAISKNVHQQTTNAISNGGVALYVQGKKEEALEQFMLALERPDQFAEGEASWFIARIYEDLGDKKQSKAFSKRCEDAGGYTPPRFISQD